MATLDEKMEKARNRLARMSVGSDGRDVRPTLWHWMLEGILDKSGPFQLDALTASAVYPSAYWAWYGGMLAGPQPTPTSIGITLRKIGCTVWRPDRCKFWQLPGRDHDAARLKGGAYWLRRAKNLEHGGDPDWEPDPLYQKKNHDLYHGPAAKIARLYQDKDASPTEQADLSPSWL